MQVYDPFCFDLFNLKNPSIAFFACEQVNIDKIIVIQNRELMPLCAEVKIRFRVVLIKVYILF